MSIEKNLGVESIDTPLMVSARTAWSRWVADDPALGVVADLADLQRWWRKEAPEVRDGVLARLAALASDEVDAAVALAWMLVPGAKGVASRLRDVAADIDGVVASQLWMEIRGSEPPPSYVAKTILRNVENAIKAEHGIGDAGERADRMWSVASLADVIDVLAPDNDPDASPELQRVLRVLLQYLIDVGELSIQDAHLLLTAADYADWLGKPMRGRAGLTALESLESLTKLESKKARTMRREVGKLLDRITALAPSLDIEMLLAQYPDDGICFADWSFGLGRPRDAAAMRRFREEELSMIRAHVVTWDPVTEQCGAPDICPECMRAEFKRERDALAKAG